MSIRRASGRSKEAATRQRIVSGARRHFLTHGFRNVTMDDVAAELGMSKKTLYAHFSAKRGLLDAVIYDKYRDISTTLEPIAAAASDDFPRALRDLLAAMQRQAQEIHPAFVRDMRREEPEAFRLVEQLRQDVIEKHFGRLFEAGRRRGLVRRDIPTRAVIEILLGAVQGLVNPTKLAELDMSPQAAFNAVTSIILEGAIVRPATKAHR